MLLIPAKLLQILRQNLRPNDGFAIDVATSAITIVTSTITVATSNIAIAILDNILLRSQIGMACFRQKNKDFHHKTGST